MSKLKKSMAIILSAAVVMSIGSTISASATGSGDNTNTPHTIFATFNGDAHTSRGFTWFTDKDSLKTQIEIGKSADLSDEQTYSNTDAGNTYTVTGGDRTDGTTNNANLTEYGHKIVVSSLTPGTKYYYKVGDSTTTSGLSTVGSFTTEGTSNSFSFIDVTDTQASVYGTSSASDLAAANADYASNVAPLLDQAFKTVPDASFVMDNGDITENGGDLKQWNLFTSTTTSNLMNTTFVPIAGNHETYEAHDETATIGIANSYSGYTAAASNNGALAPTTAQIFGICGPIQNALTNHFNLALPSTSAESADQLKTGAYYSFDYGNSHFMVLNTNDLVPTSTYTGTTESKVGGTLSDAQISWLNADAAASTQQWKIVVFHRAVESDGSHVSQADVTAIRAQILPLMAKDNIDLVLQGHDHTYLRSYQINSSVNPVNFPAQITENYNGVSTKYDVNATGTVYIIPGASDNKMYASPATLPATVFPAISIPALGGKTLDPTYDPNASSASGMPTYAGIKIDGNKLMVTAYQVDVTKKTQTVIDTYALAKSSDESALVTKIGALPAADSLTASDATAVKAAYNAYNALDAIDQIAVTNSDVLLNDVDLMKQIAPDVFATSSAPTNFKTGSNQKALPIALVGLFLSLGIASALIVLKRKSSKQN